MHGKNHLTGIDINQFFELEIISEPEGKMTRNDPQLASYPPHLYLVVL
jgi:hypothetical protein